MLWVERLWAKTQMYRATQLQGTHVSHHDSGTLRKVGMLNTQDTHTQDGLSRQKKTKFFSGLGMGSTQGRDQMLLPTLF